MSNVLTIHFGSLRYLVSPQHLTQYDYGQVVMPGGISLPESYDVEFAYNTNSSPAHVTGTVENGIPIPDILLRSHGNLHMWIVLHEGENDGKTAYHVVIPVDARA